MSTSNVTTWFEITTREKEATLDFYTKVFGYTTQDLDMGPMGTYPMFANQDGPFAGLQHMNSEEWGDIPAHWMSYFRTEDIAASAKQVPELGGQVKYGPFDMPDGGQIAICLDNQNAPFTLMQLGPEGDKYKNTAISWIEHVSQDPNQALDFYSKLFTWETQTQDMGPEIGTYSMFHNNNDFHAGAMKAPEPFIPAHWLVYLITPNIEETLQKIQAHNGTVVVPQMHVPETGEIAIVQDPSDAVFGIHQPL